MQRLFKFPTVSLFQVQRFCPEHCLRANLAARHVESVTFPTALQDGPIIFVYDC